MQKSVEKIPLWKGANIIVNRRFKLLIHDVVNTENWVYDHKSYHTYFHRK